MFSYLFWDRVGYSLIQTFLNRKYFQNCCEKPHRGHVFWIQILKIKKMQRNWLNMMVVVLNPGPHNFTAALYHILILDRYRSKDHCKIKHLKWFVKMYLCITCIISVFRCFSKYKPENKTFSNNIILLQKTTNETSPQI